jgi:hypothetical protein
MFLHLFNRNGGQLVQGAVLCNIYNFNTLPATITLAALGHFLSDQSTNQSKNQASDQGSHLFSNQSNQSLKINSWIELW